MNKNTKKIRKKYETVFQIDVYGNEVPMACLENGKLIKIEEEKKEKKNGNL